MNKIALILAPIAAAGILFGYSGTGFLKSGVPEMPEKVEVYALTEKGKELLKKEIINPLQGKKRTGKAEMYSRCPSGVTHYVTAAPTEQEPYYAGRVVDRTGCHSTTVCYFRMDEAEEVLEAKSTEEADYRPVAEWRKSMRGQWSF